MRAILYPVRDRAIPIMQLSSNASTSPLPRGVRRALDAMRGNAGHDWSVAELAEAAGLSSRT